ncbi:helix-turn-helix transcriptional regulator [Kitasatospora sp. NPDC101157]|uniref:helix-turn-helix domain-containing protein n=1 Tax=Kitasatospora sp. NPDC101157 TaxID=3364098 RepID=UPI0037F8EC51
MNDFATTTATAGSEPAWTLALDRLGRLTPRECEVFVMLAEGLGNRQMAARLQVTERTVRAHLTAVLEKLELESRLSGCLASYAHHISSSRASRAPAA